MLSLLFLLYIIPENLTFKLNPLGNLLIVGVNKIVEIWLKLFIFYF